MLMQIISLTKNGAKIIEATTQSYFNIGDNSQFLFSLKPEKLIGEVIDGELYFAGIKILHNTRFLSTQSAITYLDEEIKENTDKYDAYIKKSSDLKKSDAVVARAYEKAMKYKQKLEKLEFWKAEVLKLPEIIGGKKCAM